MVEDCKYVVNNEGNVILLHPKTGEPLQNCKITKSEFAVCTDAPKAALDTTLNKIESSSKYLLSPANEANSSITPDTTVITSSENYKKTDVEINNIVNNLLTQL